MKPYLFLLVALAILVSNSYAQNQCASGPNNKLVDYGFENGGTYCRNSSSELDNDDITLCVIGYDGRNLTYDLGGATQVNLATQFTQPGWTSTGEVDIVNGDYQYVHGFWGIKLNGQFGAGSISQNFQITQANPQCNVQYYSATNAHAPYNFTASYTVTLSKGGTTVGSQNLFGPPNSALQGNNIYSTATNYFTLPGAGTYTLTFTSNDNTPVVFNDGLFPTQTYYGRTGIVIDDVCFSCLVTPSPSISPSASSPPSISASPVPTVTPSPSPSPSSVPAPSCPAFIDDDHDHWEHAPHRDDDEDSHDSTIVNVYFADILNSGKRW